MCEALKTYEQMTKEERAQLMITDYGSYAEMVPEGFWLLLLDGVARAGGISEDEKRSLTSKAQ